MAINPLITMGVKPINLDFSDRRLRNAHSDLYEQQADVQRQNIEQEKATMEALKTYDGTPQSMDNLMRVNPKAAMGVKAYQSKQLQDSIAVQKIQMESDKEARLAEGADIENRLKELKLGTERAGIVADIVSPLLEKPDLSLNDVEMAVGSSLGRGALSSAQAIDFLGKLRSKPFNAEATRAELKTLYTTGRGEVDRAKIKETALEAARKAVLFPLEVKKAEGEAANVTRDPVTGRTPGDVVLDQRTVAQRLFDEKKAQEQRDFQASENQKNRSVTMRGQNMTDARTRELTEATRGNKPLTEPENRNFGFYDRARQSQQALDAVEAEIADKGYIGQKAMKILPNVLQSDTNQSFQQARRQFTEAYLRRDSGAAISPSEYENADNTFFVQPGDGPKVIEQKRKARETVINALKVGSGRAIEKYEGEQKPSGGIKPPANRPPLSSFEGKK